MGHFEATMWKNYYQRRYFHLIKGIYQASRHVRFSPATSVWIAFKAGIAASSFQASRSRQEAERAIPALVEYFKAVAPGAASAFSAEAAAHAELDWWQARREAVPPSEYGLTIARVAAMLYGVDNATLRQAGILRAQAMNYRDTRKATVTDADWQSIDEQLTQSYSLLKKAISSIQ
jgi:hypothetical protein